MIPPRIQIPLYIFIALLSFLSCQKKTNYTSKKDNKEEVEKLILEADNLYKSDNKYSAFASYNTIKLICNPISDPENYVHTINRMAEIQQNDGDYAGSESTASEALPYLKRLKDSKHKWNLCIIQGINLMNTFEYQNALHSFNDALKLSTNDIQKQTALNNIAVVYMRLCKYKDALQILLSITIDKTALKSPKDNARILDNIGFCYYKIKDTRAFSYLNSALQIRSGINDTSTIGTSYLHLAKFYEKENKSLCEKYTLLSYKHFTLSNNPDGILEVLKMLIKTSPYKELKKHSFEYVKINDSIKELRQRAKNQFAKIKYSSKVEKEENLTLKTYKVENELQLERQKNRNILLYIIILISLSFILILYFYLTSRGKREKIEAAYKSEIRIAKKLHDELANDIYHTMAFAENKNLSIEENKEQLLNNLDIIYSRTRDISKESSDIVTGKNYIFSLKEMISGFNTPNINLILNGLDTILWDEIERKKKITIYRVLQELLVNMKKYSGATLVCINFKSTDKNINISYTDNGKGIDINKIVFKNGLHNIESRILKIKGKITIDSEVNKGFKVFIKFPL